MTVKVGSTIFTRSQIHTMAKIGAVGGSIAAFPMFTMVYLHAPPFFEAETMGEWLTTELIFATYLMVGSILDGMIGYFVLKGTGPTGW
ncbi:hypothetical protein BDQ12DRAFT_694218 [Crucibulum laeve]|uniref:Uncharacterized protein n=1 Tax=Crucibulum laeve TaxID=68775 RepID=A0A5C3LF76_9AGAR|nr:hypothetical protein BDQ12DRAFT_694218 [Crucibulum laeve]